MGKRSYESDYESVRNAHISENKARMEMLGLSRTKEELNMMTPPPAPRPYTYKQYATGPPRRSPRLNGLAVQHKALPLRGHLGKATPMLVDYDSDAPAVVGGEMAPAPQDNGGEEMGAVYEPVHGETATSVGEIVLRG
ncbi:uncharacterized protein [Miscanthus floridulus]|uniref:uncharacterized protein n=1 Tax=Miscanthus floridulus TaxID=154761 RepID=UPI00345A90C9